MPSYTPAQFNAAERATIRNALGNQQIADRLIDKLDGTGKVGTKGTGSAITVSEQSAGHVHVTKITLNALAVSMVDGTTNGSIGSKKIYTFPSGLIKMLSARTNLTVSTTTGIGASAALKHSVGSAAAATNDTLSLTKANIIPSTSTTLSSQAGSPKGKSAATAITALTDNSGGTSSNTIAAQTGSYVQATQQNTIASIAAKINEIIARITLNGESMDSLLDGLSSAVDVYLNFGVADADSSGNATVTVSGTIYLVWEWGGE